MNRAQCLNKAKEIVAARGEEYAPPFENFTRIAKRWSMTLGIEVTASQVVRCMIDLKLARLQYDPFHEDSILDISGYGAVLAEIVEEEQREERNNG